MFLEFVLLQELAATGLADELKGLVAASSSGLLLESSEALVQAIPRAV